ncbi:uncharacterized protein [Epargyreus clarus]|uniref:uncharacterized protein n=1 Tax=Epargyreus clarus TaxID=520877 RepID=UPI003C2EAFE0
MAHLQYMPGDPRLVDQLVYELKSKGIFDQFRKDCIADVDTRPAYQNLRQRVESSVSTFLSRQCWQPDLNKNQLREKLRKHILDGNYLEQGVERIVDQVVNPKVASVFIPQVEDLVYNYLGITRKKSVTTAESSNEKIEDLLPTDLEAVSPGSVKSNDDKNEAMDIDTPKEETKMDVDQEDTSKFEPKDENSSIPEPPEKIEQDIATPGTSENTRENDVDQRSIPLPADDIKLENIPSPEDTPPQKIELEKIALPEEINVTADIPLPDEIPKDAKDEYFKPINSEDDESSSDSSLRRNMSPLTPIRNFNNENSCDAQQAFENNVGENKTNEQKEPNTFRFAIDVKSPENSMEAVKTEKKDKEQNNLSYHFNNQVNINNFNTPLYEDSSNSNNLQIDYESDANSKVNLEPKVIEEQSMDEKKDKKTEEKKSSHKSSHRSRDSSKHSSSKDKRSESKPSSSRDRHDKKSSKDDHSKSKSNHKDKSSDRSDKDKKDSDKKERDSSKHRSSHRSSSHKDSKSHKSSSSSQRHSSKHSDEKKSSSSSNKDKSERSSERSSDKSSKDRSLKDSKSSSQRSDKDRKSSSSNKSSKQDDKDKDKKKKVPDDHYSLSGRGNSNRRSTDRDSNDGSSSSKGSQNPSSSKSSTSQKDSKGNSSKSDNTSPSGDSTSPSDKDNVKEANKSEADVVQPKPIVRVDTRLELPMASPPRLPFVPDVTIRKPKFAANLEEAKKLMKMRRFLDEEQKRMNQEAALLLEFQANVRPSLSQVYSSIPGPELEFACVINNDQTQVMQNNPVACEVQRDESIRISNPTNALLAVVNAQKIEDITGIESELSNLTESNDSKDSENSMNDTDMKATEPIEELEAKQESEEINVQNNDDGFDSNDAAEARVPDVGDEVDDIKETIEIVDDSVSKSENEKETDDDSSVQEIDSEAYEDSIEQEENDSRTEYFEITVIAEELSESEETQNVMEKFQNDNNSVLNDELVSSDIERLPLDNNNTVFKDTKEITETACLPDEPEFRYFSENEVNETELQRDYYSKFLKGYIERESKDKIYLINCDSYEESVVKGVLESLGNYEVINYHRNGHLKLPKTNSIVKNVNVASEVSLPFDNNEFESAASELEMDLKVTRRTVLSPVKSECSFELSSDYDAKLDEMVNNASRQQIMEIILGNAMSSESPSKMPTIDYITECNIDSDEGNLKRKISEVETSVNNNRPVLTPRKLRKMSTSDQITSTTQEAEVPHDNTLQNTTRSKYLQRARRVGLPRPRKTDQPNSPSSDKSVENYEQNTKDTTVLSSTPNGKIKTPQRNKIQRYDTSDLYKPKLHYLSRRNNIS